MSQTCQFLRTDTRQIANKLFSVVSPSFWCSVFFNDVFNIFSYLSLFGLNSDQKKSIYLILPRLKMKDSRIRIFCLCWSISDRAAWTRVGFFCFMPRTQRAKTPWRDGGLCWQDWKSSVLAGSAPWKNNYYIFLPTV